MSSVRVGATGAGSNRRTRLHRRGGVVIVLAVLASIALARASASVALDGPGVIRITERQIGGGRVDVGRRGPSIGDIEVQRALLYNKGITPDPIGHSELVCTYTGTRSRQCNGTFFLTRGKIVVSGPLLYRQFFQLVVVGGAGLYANVRGTLTVTGLTDGPHRVDILLFRLVP